jgi:DNA mismatch repair protein MutL
VGTRIEVRHLFFNTPARRKFLRTTATELGHISEAVTRLALALPTLHCKLIHNERVVFEVPASAGLRERIGLFFGREVEKELLPIEAAAGPVRLSGFVAKPSCERGNPRMQYLYVNGRWIRDRSLGHALQEAYRGLIMTGRYCVAFLFLELPPDQVDVNVHPTKTEVRFRDGQALYHLILATIREKLRAADLTATLRPAPSLLRLSSPPPRADSGPSQLFPGREPQGAILGPRPLMAEAGLATDRVNSPTELIEEAAETAEASPLSEVTQPMPPPQPSEAPSSLESPQPPQPDRPFKAIQLHDAYLVLETPEGMLVIDQHALHERILYEQWKARLRAGTVERQRLLVPEPVDLPAEQAACALENKLVLEQLGLGLEDFGGNTVLVTSYPAIVRNGSPAELLRTTVDYLMNIERPPTAEQLLDDLLRLMACRSAIKAGDHLSPEEITALVAHRHLADDTHHCPHGRPTALFFSKHELDRQFKRV